MPGREIPRDEWVAFFDSFSRQHDGWLSTVEVREAEIGAQIEWLEKALMGVTADLTEQNGDVISILVGGKSDDHVAHVIRAGFVAATVNGRDFHKDAGARRR